MKSLKTILLIVFVFSAICISAQTISREVISSAGKRSIISGTSIESSIGEVAITTLYSTNHILTQGFEQADNLIITEAFSGNSSKEYSMLVFPNPAIDKISIENKLGNDFLIRITDCKGQLVNIEMPVLQSDKCFILDISDLKSGAYILCILDPKTHCMIANYKVIKL